MREVIVKLYQYDELPTDKAKANARDWFRQGESEEFGQFGEVYERAETATKLLGIEFYRHDVQLLGGGKRSEPDIWWSVSGCQGDGASFTGTYQYAKGCARKIAREFPRDAEIQRIASELQELQRKHSYKLTATITQSGREADSSTMDVEITSPQSVIDADDSHYEKSGILVRSEPLGTLLGLMRNFADWIYRGIRDEYEYRLEDAQIEESIRANDYDFREDGTRSDG